MHFTEVQLTDDIPDAHQGDSVTHIRIYYFSDYFLL